MNNKRKQLIVKIVAHLVLLLGAITMLVPFIWMLSSSVKSLGEVFVFPPTLFGEKIVWENYTKISSRFDYLAYFLNSVKVSAWVVIFQVFTSATAGYVFAKLNFKGRDRIFTLYLATMIHPVPRNGYHELPADVHVRTRKYALVSDASGIGIRIRYIFDASVLRDGAE